MMKAIWPASLIALGLGLGLPNSGERWTLLIGGDTNGYLAPCGCAKPMAGGIERRVALLRQLGGERAVLLENGGLVKGVSEQDALKADALVEALKSAGVDAVNLGPEEARRGVSGVLSMTNLAPNLLLCSTLPANDFGIRAQVAKGPFLIGGVSSNAAEIARSLGVPDESLDAAIRRLVSQAESGDRIPILLLRGSESEARRIAGDHPAIALIVYSSAGTPPAQPRMVGRTALVTPGDKGLFVLSVAFEGGKLVDFSVVPVTHLGAADPQTTAIFRAYLDRVSRAGLLDRLPRSKGGDFVGTPRCVTCHTQAGNVWKSSAHARALGTLEAKGHDRDPECVGCHVVGLDFEGGFRSRGRTPELADVGCESCHGAGRQHAGDPIKYPMGRVGAQSCAPCHVPDHSPTFDFETYWRKIAHE